MPRPYNVININGHIVPATFPDGLKKILQDVQTGRTGASAHAKYRRKLGGTACMCAIGTFFTDAQLDQIVARRWNGADANALANAIGAKNMEAMIGMEVGVAGVVQSDFDFFSNFSSGNLNGFTDRLRGMLDTTTNRPNPATKHTGAWHFPVSGQ